MNYVKMVKLESVSGAYAPYMPYRHIPEFYGSERLRDARNVFGVTSMMAGDTLYP
jgi:hypothetical protein